jgi:hypothetical protein
LSTSRLDPGGASDGTTAAVAFWAKCLVLMCQAQPPRVVQDSLCCGAAVTAAGRRRQPLHFWLDLCEFGGGGQKAAEAPAPHKAVASTAASKRHAGPPAGGRGQAGHSEAKRSGKAPSHRRGRRRRRRSNACTHAARRSNSRRDTVCDSSPAGEAAPHAARAEPGHCISGRSEAIAIRGCGGPPPPGDVRRLWTVRSRSAVRREGVVGCRLSEDVRVDLCVGCCVSQHVRCLSAVQSTGWCTGRFHFRLAV